MSCDFQKYPTTIQWRNKGPTDPATWGGWGAIREGTFFPEFTVFIPKNREYLAQLSFRQTGKIGGTKSSRGHQKGYKGCQKKWRPFFNFVFRHSVFVGGQMVTLRHCNHHIANKNTLKKVLITLYLQSHTI